MLVRPTFCFLLLACLGCLAGCGCDASSEAANDDPEYPYTGQDPCQNPGMKHATLYITLPAGFTGYARIEEDPARGTDAARGRAFVLDMPVDRVLTVKPMDLANTLYNIEWRYDDGRVLPDSKDIYVEGDITIDQHILALNDETPDPEGYPFHASLVSAHVEDVDGVDTPVVILYVGRGLGSVYYNQKLFGKPAETYLGKDIPDIE